VKQQHSGKLPIFVTVCRQLAGRQIVSFDTDSDVTGRVLILDGDCASLPASWQRGTFESQTMHVESVGPVELGQFAEHSIDQVAEFGHVLQGDVYFGGLSQ